ncbi:MAG TPA: FecR family protein [Candidatus Binataceae bacterium]|nr:FecR family protein [Candidatus Binataceae bacterium]
MLKVTTRIVASASFFAVILLLYVPHAWAQTSAGLVSAVSGTVSIERAGRSIPAADGSAVQVGDRFTTGPNSRITIKLSDGSQLELNESSTLVLTEDTLNPDGSRASTKVTLLSGLVRSLVHFSPAGAPNFEVHTPNAVASARGTMFDVSYHEGQPPPAMP